MVIFNKHSLQDDDRHISTDFKVEDETKESWWHLDALYDILSHTCVSICLCVYECALLHSHFDRRIYKQIYLSVCSLVLLMDEQVKIRNTYPNRYYDSEKS